VEENHSVKFVALEDGPATPLGQEIDAAVTMGCGDACPLVLAKQRLEWNIPDPKAMSPEDFREVRNLIESKVKELIETL
jgi:protein-tyrosine-phosphatase